MKEYKIYIETPEGRKKLPINYNKNDLIVALTIIENIVKGSPNKHPFIIAYDPELDMDETLIYYYGNYERYSQKRDLLLMKDAINKRKELLSKISDTFTKKYTKK